MTDLDTQIRPKVATLAETYGAQLTFTPSRSREPETFNPATGAYTTGTTPTTYQYYCTPPQPYSRGYGEGAETAEGELEVLLPAYGLNATFETDYLEEGLEVLHGVTLWIVTRIESLYSGAQVAAYRLIMQPRCWNTEDDG